MSERVYIVQTVSPVQTVFRSAWPTEAARCFFDVTGAVDEQGDTAHAAQARSDLAHKIYNYGTESDGDFVVSSYNDPFAGTVYNQTWQHPEYYK